MPCKVIAIAVQIIHPADHGQQMVEGDGSLLLIQVEEGFISQEVWQGLIKGMKRVFTESYPDEHRNDTFCTASNIISSRKLESLFHEEYIIFYLSPVKRVVFRRSCKSRETPRSARVSTA
jgi:hypothetical protein